MKKALAILLAVIFFAGCNSDPELTFTEISVDDLNEDIQNFFKSVQGKNGVYLYDDQEKYWFVYLNAMNVEQDDEAEYFTNFDIESQNESLNLYYESEKTSDYSTPNLKNEMFYKIELDRDYEMVRLFKNGEETHFDTVSGSQKKD